MLKGIHLFHAPEPYLIVSPFQSKRWVIPGKHKHICVIWLTISI